MKGAILRIVVILVVAAALAVLVIWWVSAHRGPALIDTFINPYVFLNGRDSLAQIRGPDSSDHIRGVLSAPLVVVEYSDLECPYCKQSFHNLEAVLQDPRYQNDVAVVLRHFPLDHRHVKGRPEAEAAECVGILKGNDAFWRYVSAVFELTRSNDSLDLKVLPPLAEDEGIDRGEFEACQQSAEIRARVQRDVDDALAGGLSATPSAVVFRDDGKRSLIIGAQSVATYKRIFDVLLGREVEPVSAPNDVHFTE